MYYAVEQKTVGRDNRYKRMSRHSGRKDAEFFLRDWITSGDRRTRNSVKLNPDGVYQVHVTYDNFLEWDELYRIVEVKR